MRAFRQSPNENCKGKIAKWHEKFGEKLLHFDRVCCIIIKRLGALAQLVARNVRNVEVGGSNPPCSTKQTEPRLTQAGLFF